MKLDGKVAVVTGATSGIGRCTAELMVQEGACVVLCGRRSDLGHEIAKQLGENAVFAQTDIMHEAHIKSAIELAKSHFGRLDIVFNNAGGPAPPGEIATIDASAFDDAVSLLLKSVFLGIKHAAPILQAQGSGAIISNASVAAHLGGYATSHLYSALKAAVVQLSKSVALELAEDNVRVNTVSPGAIATGIFARGAGLASEQADATARKMQSALKNAQPIPRAGVPNDVAKAVVFLASDDAGFITGRDLVIDGGAIAGRSFSKVQAQREAMNQLF
ncbi:MAG: SDR family oxidoreductase [Pseudomonadota bacterium]